MVGLKKFSSHFSSYKDHYVLIGGAASWLVLDAAGLEPRATKDVDIVLCLEVLDAQFGKVLWNFIQYRKEQMKKSTLLGCWEPKGALLKA